MSPLRRKTLIEINHYCITSNLIVIDRFGLLQIINCPFKVVLIADPIVILYVEEVKTSADLELLYLIKGKLNSYYLFEIIID